MSLSTPQSPADKTAAEIQELYDQIKTLRDRLSSIELKTQPTITTEDATLNKLKEIGSWNYSAPMRNNTGVPTYVPRTREEQFYLVVNSTETNLYIYNNSAWKHITLT